MEPDTKFPKLKWAQRAEYVLMTVELADSENVAIDIDEETNTLIFSAQSAGSKYGFKLALFEKVSKDESKWNTKGRNVILNISKVDKEQEEWWPRLTKDKAKNHQIVIDFDKWVDADDEPEEEKGGMGDMDPSMMQGMGGGGGGPPGMGGMGGMPGMGGMGGMPGMGGMGGMPGMGGMGGMPGMGGGGPGGPGAGGMDMAALQQMMAGMGGGGAGGAGGMGGMDPAKMQEMMAGMGMGGGMGGGGDEDDDAEEEGESTE
jgi:hypothetical protein